MEVDNINTRMFVIYVITHLERNPIVKSTVSRLDKKFKETGYLKGKLWTFPINEDQAFELALCISQMSRDVNQALDNNISQSFEY